MKTKTIDGRTPIGPDRRNPRTKSRKAQRADGLTQYEPNKAEVVERVIAADAVARLPEDGGSGGLVLDMSITSERGVLDGWGDMEYIDHDPKEFSVDRFTNVGAVLVNHDPDQRVGMPLDVRINEERRRSEATVRFSDTDAGRKAFEEATVHGTLRGVSGGFIVKSWIWLEEGDSYKDRFNGPAWVGVGNELMEASLTPIPADPDVGVNRNRQRLNQKRNEVVKMNSYVKFLRDNGSHAVGDVVEMDQSGAEQLIAEGIATRYTPVVGDGIHSRMETEDKSTQKSEPAGGVDKPSGNDSTRTMQDMLSAERARCSEIRALGKQHSVDVQEMIDNGSSVEDGQRFVLDVVHERGQSRVTAPTGGDVQVTSDGRESFIRAASHGVQVRAGGVYAERANASRSKGETQDNGGEAFGGYSMTRLAEECLRRANITVPQNTNELIARAMAGPPIVSFDIERRAAESITVGTSDFPLILANVVNKAMLAGVELAETTYRSWCRIGSGADFKAMSRLRLSEAGKLAEVAEFGTYPTTKFSEQREQITIKTFGEVYNLSRQAIINDDVGAFTDIPMALGRAAAILPNDEAVKVLLSNPTMSDATALFATGHNNNSAVAGNAFTSVANARTGIGNLVTKLMQQTAFQHSDLSSEQMNLRLRPSVLLAPPTGWEHPTAVLGGTSFGAGVDGVNPLQGIANLVIEPSLEDTNFTGNSTTAYYLFTAPTQAPIIEVAFLNGVATPFMEEVVNQGSAADGRVWKVRMDCVAGAIDWRGAMREVGA